MQNFRRIDDDIWTSCCWRFPIHNNFPVDAIVGRARPIAIAGNPHRASAKGAG